MNFYSPVHHNQGYSHQSSAIGRSTQIMNLVVEATPEDGGDIYIGNLEAASNVEYLKRHNIQAVLTVAGGTGLRYNRQDIPLHETINADDALYQDLSQYFDRMIDFIARARKQTNILVHCYAGISRSVSAVIAYLIQRKGWNYERSISFIKSKRSIANPNPAFVRQLKHFESAQNQYQSAHNPYSHISYDRSAQKQKYQPIFVSTQKTHPTAEDLYDSPIKRTHSAIPQRGGLNYQSLSQPLTQQVLPQRNLYSGNTNPNYHSPSVSKVLFGGGQHSQSQVIIPYTQQYQNPYPYSKQNSGSQPVFASRDTINRGNSASLYPQYYHRNY